MGLLRDIGSVFARLPTRAKDGSVMNDFRKAKQCNERVRTAGRRAYLPEKKARDRTKSS